MQVVDISSQRIGLGRSIFRTTVKFLPQEISHFCIWCLILSTNLLEITVLTILSAVNLVAFIYLLSQLMNKKRKTLYDWIAGTKAISKWQVSKHLYAPKVKMVPTIHKPSHQQRTLKL
ncbi:RDD family protein [Bacillus bingmayongensis]|nr:RDD family protein [Bacillus bingmayongensis]